MSKFGILFVFSWLMVSPFVQAQMPGGAMAPPEFDAEKAAGIFIYETEEVLKKLKISDSETKQEVVDALRAYNTKMDDLSFQHAATFRQLDESFETNVQIAFQNRDRSQMNGVKADIERIIPPIRKEVAAEEQALNTRMAATLTEKQNDKWLKYQKRKKGNNNLPGMTP